MGALKTLKDKIYMHTLPAYGNKIFFGLGFLALTSLLMLVATGITLAFMGQAWWLHDPLGIYVRSVHLWSVQAFIGVLVLHLTVGFLTSGFKKPRRIVWVLGALIFCLALITTEFGYGLRGDFSSQFRQVSGADFWNGAYLGWWVNPLSQFQEFALHIAIIPFLIFALFIAHYILERSYGISKPYRDDIKYRMVAADHKVMYTRGVILVVAIVTLAYFFPSPYVPAITIQSVAQQNPSLVEQTLIEEYNRTSDTATYLDSIDPYTFDTRTVFVEVPYEQLIGALPAAAPKASVTATSTAATSTIPASSTPAAVVVIAATSSEAAGSSADLSNDATQTTATITPKLAGIIATLMPAMRTGTYQAILDAERPSYNDTYSLRFLNDMDVLEEKAGQLGFATDQWGMAKDENGHWLLALPPGSWWLTPLGAINSTFDLLNNDNGDRIGAEILGALMLIFIAFPYIPFLNRLPELLHVAPLIWRDPEAEKGGSDAVQE